MISSDSHSSDNLSRLLAGFRSGQPGAVDQLLRRYRPWLRLLAGVQMESCVKAKFDPSDIVQQAMLEASKAAPQFRGNSEAEWLAWMRQILAHALAHELRRYRGTQKRDVSRERSLGEQLTQSSLCLANTLAASASSPAQRAERSERELLLAQWLEALPVDYREVIILRNLQGLSHEQIAARMHRTPGAIRMLWVRALAALKEKAESGGENLDGAG